MEAGSALIVLSFFGKKPEKLRLLNFPRFNNRW